MHVRVANCVILVAGVIYFLLNLLGYIRPELVCLILGLAGLGFLILALLFTSIVGFLTWRKTTQLWMIPALISLAFIISTWLTPPMGRFLADRLFMSHLSEYQKAVAALRADPDFSNSPAGADIVINEAKYLPSRVKAIKGVRCEDGSLVAAFLFATDVPVFHEGYLYKDNEEGHACVKETMRRESDEGWPYIRHVTGNWYHFSDQPGL